MSDLAATLVSSLTPLAVAREHNAAYPEGCKPIINGVTHCASCGFHVTTSARIINGGTAGVKCTTPEWHNADC